MSEHSIKKPCLVCGHEIYFDKDFPFRRVRCLSCMTMWYPDHLGQYTTPNFIEVKKEWEAKQ